MQTNLWHTDVNKCTVCVPLSLYLDVFPNVELTCITYHEMQRPGFTPVCYNLYLLKTQLPQISADLIFFTL